MIRLGLPTFISRPRRFGKSLTVSTLEAIFEGKRELFKDLWIDSSDWDWESYPVIRFDMSNVNSESKDLVERSLIRRCNEIASHYQLVLSGDTPSDYFAELIIKLNEKTNKNVVILIDEYDKPLIDRLDDLELAMSIRETLKSFYLVNKSYDGDIKFVFLTSVTKFSKVSVFSGLNNLTDLTLDATASDMMGYTKEEISHYFSLNIKDLSIQYGISEADCYQQIKEWYNGYRFSREEKFVYNPFSVLRLFHAKIFSSHWFETATPTFLLNLIKSRHFDVTNIENLKTDESGFSSFEIDNLPTLAILYQTGYLTITSYESVLSTFTLGFPNREVTQSFFQSLIRYFSSENANTINYIAELSFNLLEKNWRYDQFFDLLNKLLALIPYDLYIKQEKYFHSLFYLIIKLTGTKVNAEVHTQLGRVDAVIEMKDKIIIFELKSNKSAEEAINQIKEMKYYQIYSDRNLPTYLVGMNFSDSTRTIAEYLIELI